LRGIQWERKKRAYRYLLYWAMLDIRPIAWAGFRFFNPFNWRKMAQQVQRAGAIAGWLHNLALYSAVDFDRFNEEWFWDEIERRRRQDPQFHLEHYREMFDREMAGEGHLRDR
jgi:hypothetical protein